MVRVRFYSEFRELYGKEEQSIEVPHGSRVQGVLLELVGEKTSPAENVVETILRNSIVLVNGTISPANTEVGENDLISILPFITCG